MNGSVIKRGNRWSICYYIGKDENGKWKQKWESGFSTKKEAQRVLRSRVEAVEASYGSKLSGITLGGFLRYWLDTYCQQNLAPNTIRGYRTNIEKHVIPILGTTPLIKISPKSLQDLYTKLLANVNDQEISSTVFVYGSALMADDSMLASSVLGNRTVLLDSLLYNKQKTDVMDIPIVALKSYSLDITSGEVALIRTVMMYLLPIGLCLVGGVIWIRRKKR